MREEEPTYYETVQVRRSGKNHLLRVDPSWGLEVGDVVDVSIWPLSDPGLVIRNPRRIAKRGTSGRCIYIPTKWGFEPGQLVCVTVRKAAYVSDPGSGAEEEDQGAPE